MADEFDEYEELEAEAEALEEVPAREVKAQPKTAGRDVSGARIAQVTREARPIQTAPMREAVKQAPAQEITNSEKKPRYVIEHQPEILALVDTQTNEVQILASESNIKNEGVYVMLAKVLNDQDTVITGAGYQ